MAGWSSDDLARRLASDVPDGWIVNIGVGQPQTVIAHLQNRPVLLHSENGILGLGPLLEGAAPDPDIIDAGKAPASLRPGGSFMDSETSFALIRGGRLNLGIMGAYEISADGDLANWKLAGVRFGGVGGAQDVASGAKEVWAMTSFLAKDGSVKLVRNCRHPLTARRVVRRVYTDYGIFRPEGARFGIVELAPGVDGSRVAELGVPL